MSDEQRFGLRFIHHVLADPIRLQVLESLWQTAPQSAKEFAASLNVLPDRLYYHLAQLEKASLVEVASYRSLPGGKVKRLYRPTTIEPPGDNATAIEVAQFLNTTLEATQIDIAAASFAKSSGEQRVIHLSRATLRLSDVLRP